MLDGKVQTQQIDQEKVVKLEDWVFKSIEGCIYFNSTMRNTQGMLILIRKGGPME